MKQGEKSRRKKKPKGPYTKGELNKLIDSLTHPLFKEDPAYIIIDSLLHTIIEQNPPTSFRKFIKHNLPKLIQQLEEKHHKGKE